MNRGIQRFVIGLVAAAAVVTPAAGATGGGTAAAAAAPTSTLVVSASSTYIVNTVFEAAVVLITNIKRVAVGCRPVRVNSNLRAAARRHSGLMARAKTMSHQLPGEPSLGTRVTQAGYVGWRRLSENLAAGYSTARLTVRAWWNSPGHRRNIADCSVREIGVSVVFDGIRPYITQNFGRR